MGVSGAPGVSAFDGVSAPPMAGVSFAPFSPFLAFDFLTSQSLPAGASFTRATAATYRDGDGVRRTASSGVPRFDHTAAGVPLGLLIEDARTNYLFNSTSPATQTTPSLATGSYTIWCEGGTSVTVAGNTATITNGGAATPGVPRTFVVTVAGTVDVTVSGAVTAFQLENGSFPTSLIITAGATAARNEDVCNFPVAGFNAATGTLYAEWMLEGKNPAVPGVNQVAARFDDGNAGLVNLVSIIPWFGGNTANRWFSASNSVLSGDVSVGGTVTAGVVGRTAAAWGGGSLSGCYNGGTVATDASAASPLTLNRVCVGFSTTPLVGWMRSISLFQDKLSSASLRQVTS